MLCVLAKQLEASSVPPVPYTFVKPRAIIETLCIHYIKHILISQPGFHLLCRKLRCLRRISLVISQDMVTFAQPLVKTATRTTVEAAIPTLMTDTPCIPSILQLENVCGNHVWS